MTENRLERPVSRGMGVPVRIVCGVMMIVLGTTLPGCIRNLHFPRNPFVRTPPCTLPPNLTKPQLVAYLNRNISALHSWRSTDIRITASGPGGIPVNLHAELAVQSPRNFRLIASSIGGNEADLGSNNERFWFWMRRNKDRHVFTATHAQADQAQQRLRIPFRPAWLMEALGVVPLDDQQFEMQQTTDPNVVKLFSERLSPSGRLVKRVIVVDVCHGHILSHNLQDENGTILARAGLNDYRVDPATGLSLPHRINLRWPKAGLTLTMRLGTIDVNPDTLPEQTWQLPTIPGYSLLDLGRLSSVVRQAARRPPRPRSLGTRFQQTGHVRLADQSAIRASAATAATPAENEQTPRWRPTPVATRVSAAVPVENPFAPPSKPSRPARTDAWWK